MILSRFFLDPVWWLFVSWLPIYLAETFGFDVKQIGLFAWVPFVGAMIGSSRNTSLQKPLTIMFTASSVGMPR